MSQTKLSLSNPNLKSSFQLLDYNNEDLIDIPTILDNLVKMGYDQVHPELFDLFESLGEDKISYGDYVATIEEIMNQKEEDTGLQRMYDLLIFNPKAQDIDRDLLKRIAEETGNHLTDFEITYLLNKAGNGKTISLDSFIDFMKN